MAIEKEIQRGSICWLHFHNQAKPGHAHCGDYGYIQCYAKKHSKKIEDGELYVKIAVKDIFWIHGHIRFVCEVMQTDGTLSYEICVDEPSRLTAFDWQWPDKLPWSVGRP
jgi:hypothetical protein